MLSDLGIFKEKPQIQNILKVKSLAFFFQFRAFLVERTANVKALVGRSRGCPGFCQEFLRGVPHQIQQASYGLTRFRSGAGRREGAPSFGNKKCISQWKKI